MAIALELLNNDEKDFNKILTVDIYSIKFVDLDSLKCFIEIKYVATIKVFMWIEYLNSHHFTHTLINSICSNLYIIYSPHKKSLFCVRLKEVVRSRIATRNVTVIYL